MFPPWNDENESNGNRARTSATARRSKERMCDGSPRTKPDRHTTTFRIDRSVAAKMRIRKNSPEPFPLCESCVHRATKSNPRENSRNKLKRMQRSSLHAAGREYARHRCIHALRKTDMRFAMSTHAIDRAATLRSTRCAANLRRFKKRAAHARAASQEEIRR